MRWHVLLVIAWLVRAALAQATEQSLWLADLAVTVWSHETGEPSKQPVIIFSHGFHGCATQSRFLMAALAAADSLVVAPNHRDAACDGGAVRWMDRAAVPFRQPAQWSDASYRDRAEDIRRLLAALQTDDRFRARADVSRLGLVGHSLGGYTVLGLGAWPQWKLPGLKAILALSPYSQPFVWHHTLAGLSAPVMYKGGTRDIGITPTLQKSLGSYEQPPAPKYYVKFENAGHFAWTDRGQTAHEVIVAYTVCCRRHQLAWRPPCRAGALQWQPVASHLMHRARRLSPNFFTDPLICACMAGASCIASHT